MKVADSEGIEPPPALRHGLVFETNVANQHLPTIQMAVVIGFEPTGRLLADLSLSRRVP